MSDEGPAALRIEIVAIAGFWEFYVGFKNETIKSFQDKRIIMKNVSGQFAKEDDWDKFFGERGVSWRDKDYRYLDEVFDVQKFSGTLLDVGCGLGDGFLCLKDKCPHVEKYYGSDISQQAVNTCSQNPALNGINFFYHDIMEPLTETFDTIICLQTLEHLSEPHVAMNNLVNAAKSLLIVAVPYRNRRFDVSHIWHFDKNDFKDVVTACCLGQKYTNIYWLVDKSGRGYSFRRNRWQTLVFEVAKRFHRGC